jgi:hypothetical protein
MENKISNAPMVSNPWSVTKTERVKYVFANPRQKRGCGYLMKWRSNHEIASPDNYRGRKDTPKAPLRGQSFSQIWIHKSV